MRRTMVLVALLALCAQAALAHDYTVYRALRGVVTGDCVSGPEINEQTFRIDEDGLSTFQDGAKLRASDAYRVAFRVENVASSPPQQGEAGTVEGMLLWTGTFTPNIAEHHWSLKKPDTSKKKMKQALVAYANAGHVSRNPDYNNEPAYCHDAP